MGPNSPLLQKHENPHTDATPQSHCCYRATRTEDFSVLTAEVWLHPQVSRGTSLCIPFPSQNGKFASAIEASASEPKFKLLTRRAHQFTSLYDSAQKKKSVLSERAQIIPLVLGPWQWHFNPPLQWIKPRELFSRLLRGILSPTWLKIVSQNYTGNIDIGFLPAWKCVGGFSYLFVQPGVPGAARDRMVGFIINNPELTRGQIMFEVKI